MWNDVNNREPSMRKEIGAPAANFIFEARGGYLEASQPIPDPKRLLVFK